MTAFIYSSVESNCLVVPPPEFDSLPTGDEPDNITTFSWKKPERSLNHDDRLYERYNRDDLFKKNLTLEFTKDPGLLKQYYRIRALENQSVIGAVDYPDEETEFDRNGHILIVHAGNFCVGGARINTRSARKNTPLPMERNGFRVEDYFPQLVNRQLAYGQASGFALLPEYRGNKLSLEMMKRGCSKGSALSLSVLFGACPELNSRLYRMSCISLGYKDTVIHDGIKLPPIPHAEYIKHQLVSIPLDYRFNGSDTAKAVQNLEFMQNNSQTEAIL